GCAPLGAISASRAHGKRGTRVGERQSARPPARPRPSDRDLRLNTAGRPRGRSLRSLRVAWNVVIAGGGFGGFYAARTIERAMPAESTRITLVNDVNFLLYTPRSEERRVGKEW